MKKTITKDGVAKVMVSTDGERTQVEYAIQCNSQILKIMLAELTICTSTIIEILKEKETITEQ